MFLKFDLDVHSYLLPFAWTTLSDLNHVLKGESGTQWVTASLFWLSWNTHWFTTITTFIIHEALTVTSITVLQYFFYLLHHSYQPPHLLSLLHPRIQACPLLSLHLTCTHICILTSIFQLILLLHLPSHSLKVLLHLIFTVIHTLQGQTQELFLGVAQVFTSLIIIAGIRIWYTLIIKSTSIHCVLSPCL